MPKIAELSIEITNNANKARVSLNNLVGALNKVKEAKKDLSFSDIDTSGLKNLYSYVSSLTRILTPLEQKCSSISSAFTKMGATSASQFAKAAEKSAELQTRMTSTSSIAASVSQGLERTANSANRVSQNAIKATESVKEFEAANKQLSASTKSVNSGFTGLIKQFGRLFKLKLMRQIVMSVMQSFTEGIKNLYEYSRAIGSIDSTNFKNTMDGYSTALLKMKNSVAAAVAPLLQQLLPVLQTVVNWFIIGVNAINQFFSALQGKKSYTRASDYFQEFAESTSAATGSVKELQRTILGFDEINKLNDNNSGGGSGGGASTPNYSQMFEEAEINTGIADFADKIKSVIERLKDIWDMAKKIWDSPLVKAVRDLVLATSIDSINLALDLIVDVLTIINDLLNGDISGAIKHTGTLFLHLTRNMQKLIRDVVAFVFDAVKQIGYKFLDIGEWVAGIYNNVVDYIDKSVSLFIDGFYTAISWVTRKWNGFVDLLNNTTIAKVLGIHFDRIKENWGETAEDAKQKWHETTEGWKIDTSSWRSLYETTMDETKRKFLDTLDTNIMKMDEYEEVWNLVCDGQWDKAIETYAEIEKKYAEMDKGIEDNPVDLKVHNSSAGRSLDELNTKMTTWSKTNYTNYPSVNTSNAQTAIAQFIRTNDGRKIAFYSTALTSDASTALNKFYYAWNGTVINFTGKLAGGITVPSKTGKFYLSEYASGGYPDYGSVFVAGESGAGAEMVGNINGRTGVASQGEITGIREAVDASSQREADLLAEQNAILREIASKSGGEINVNSIMSAMNRVNRRSGRTVVQMG